ncbi:FAD-binding protein [Candidatus Woesearchaeota archaeon]|nr:FAD-binding protein [Candidatus Woesearchaeota archaeon]
MSRNDLETITTDILIVGAGGAGLRAAIAAADAGMTIIVAGKSMLGKCHTVMAEGGINASLGNIDPQDNWKVHAADTIREGQFLNDPRMVEILAKEATDIIWELESWGCLFDRTPEGKIMQRAFGGHTFRRTCHIGDHTGLEIMQTLMAEVRRRERITTMDEVIMTKLLTTATAVAGAIGLNLRTGNAYVIKSKAIILATGGCGRVYRVSTNPLETIGDGCFLAYHAGAELMDMEMVQFHPTGMLHPKTAEGILVTESVRGEGGILLNGLGERFMKNYDPIRMELSTRDVVSRAIFTEIREGRGTAHNRQGGVWLDITHKGKAFIEKKLPKMVKQFKDFASVDITKEKMEVAPTAHYTMGGVRGHAETGATSVTGLYAVGEIAAGVHGANRLGGNSLTDILVFGRRAGRAAAAYAKRTTHAHLPQKQIAKELRRLFEPFTRKKGARPHVLREKIQDLMWKHAGIFRTQKGLTAALKQLQQLRKQTMQVQGSRRYNPEWATYLDVNCMLLTCNAIIRSALERRESRGAHAREDYPNKDDNHWLMNIILFKDRNGMQLKRMPVPPSTLELARVSEEAPNERQ